jgi:hypothetical protein
MLRKEIGSLSAPIVGCRITKDLNQTSLADEYNQRNIGNPRASVAAAPFQPLCLWSGFHLAKL